MSTKRKRVCLSILQKLEVIKLAENGVNVYALSKEFGVGHQTVRDLLKKKDELLGYASQIDDKSRVQVRKTLKRSNYANLDNAMINWLREKREEGVHITGYMCIEQAKQFYQQLGIKKTFNGSFGWLNRFKHRFGITDLNSKPSFKSDSFDNLDISKMDGDSYMVGCDNKFINLKVELDPESVTIKCEDSFNDVSNNSDADLNMNSEFSDSELVKKEVIEHSDALHCVNFLIEYCNKNNFDYTDIHVLERIKTSIEVKQLHS